MNIIIRILFVLFLFSSCNWFGGGGNTDEEPDYTPSVDWKTKVDNISRWSYPFISEGFGYYPEYIQRDRKYYSRLLKINLNNGKIVWRTDDVQVEYTAQTQKIGNYLYYPLPHEDIILVYNDNNGTLAATVSLNPLESSSSRYMGPSKHTVIWNNYIFWGNRDFQSFNQGLMRFNTSLIDFSKDANEVQLIEPECVWHLNMQSSIATNIIVNNGIVYFLTTRHNFNSGTVKISYLVALNAETKYELWIRERNFGEGNIENSLILNGNRLYVIDTTPSCYNIHSGEPIFEVKEAVFNYLHVGSMLKGISWHDNKLFYTTQNASADLSFPEIDTTRVKNIICIDGNNGNLVWGDLFSTNKSNFTFPLVYNGKAYVVTDVGLRVYDAQKGELIGVNKDIKNAGNNHNLLYNNMVIFPNRVGDEEIPPYSILTAIKAD